MRAARESGNRKQPTTDRGTASTGMEAVPRSSPVIVPEAIVPIARWRSVSAADAQNNTTAKTAASPSIAATSPRTKYAKPPGAE